MHGLRIKVLYFSLPLCFTIRIPIEPSMLKDMLYFAPVTIYALIARHEFLLA